MMIKLFKNRRNKYPIIRLWYTKYRGLTVEELIDKYIDFFNWMVSEFQDVTSSQDLKRILRKYRGE